MKHFLSFVIAWLRAHGLFSLHPALRIFVDGSKTKRVPTLHRFLYPKSFPTLNWDHLYWNNKVIIVCVWCRKRKQKTFKVCLWVTKEKEDVRNYSILFIISFHTHFLHTTRTTTRRQYQNLIKRAHKTHGAVDNRKIVST